MESVEPHHTTQFGAEPFSFENNQTKKGSKQEKTLPERLFFLLTGWLKTLLASIMTFATRATGISLFALGLMARQAAAQTEYTSCSDLKTDVEAASVAESFTLGDDLTCTEPIIIGSGGGITIDGEGFTLTVGSNFLSADDETTSGLFTVAAEGSLELNDLTIEGTEFESEGIRGIYNEGTLTVNNCVFLSLDSDGHVARGAAVSGVVLRSGYVVVFGVWCAFKDFRSR